MPRHRASWASAAVVRRARCSPRRRPPLPDSPPSRSQTRPRPPDWQIRSRLMAIDGNQWQSVAINGTCLIGSYDLVYVLLERISHRLQYVHALLVAEQLQRARRRTRRLRLRLRTRLPSEVIRGHQTSDPSDVIRRHRRPSEAIRGTHLPAETGRSRRRDCSPWRSGGRGTRCRGPPRRRDGQSTPVGKRGGGRASW